MNIGIGIDTGGTYTDAVVYDFDTDTILGTAKALTTPNALSRGILEALDALPQEPVKAAQVIALSTTLATNACVQDRGGRAKLIFLGGSRKVIDKYGAEYGLPPSGEMLIQDSNTTFSGGMAGDMDWDAFRAAVQEGFNDLDGVGIVEANAVRNSAVIEKKARELFLDAHDLPVVCGHELFNELNCLQRGASALLNARLVPVIRSFLTAIKTALNSRGINATVVIVRSDGGLMSEEFAHIRPVETLLCGPAASVLGSARLTGEANCIVVDMVVHHRHRAGGQPCAGAGGGRRARGQMENLCQRPVCAYLRFGRRHRHPLRERAHVPGGLPRDAAVRGSAAAPAGA